MSASIRGRRRSRFAPLGPSLRDRQDGSRRCIEQVRLHWPHAFVEASGNMDAARMKDIAQLGLDVVSVGGFIHQATWADLSLRVTP